MWTFQDLQTEGRQNHHSAHVEDEGMEVVLVTQSVRTLYTGLCAELELETKQLLYAERRICLEALLGVDSVVYCV